MAPSKTETHPTYKIASIPADGIGPEVIEAGITVLKKIATTLNTFSLEFENFDWSSDVYKRTGKYMPDNALDILRKFNAILFGAVGAPGKNISGVCELYIADPKKRCSGSYKSLEFTPGNLPTSTAVCKCSSNKSLPWNQVTACQLQRRGSRLGDCS